MKIIAIVSEIENNYLTIDVWDENKSSIKKIRPNYDEKEIYNIGNLVFYDEDTNVIDRNIGILFNKNTFNMLNIFELYFLRIEYTNLLIDILKKNVSCLEKEKESHSVDELILLKKEIKINNDLSKKFRIFLNVLDNVLSFIDEYILLNDNTNLKTK